MKYFFDSNVIVDAFTEREGSVETERNLLYAAVIGMIEGVVSSKQMTDIYYILRKYVSDDKNRREILSILMKGLEIVPVDKELLEAALISPVPDYEDAVIVECAKRSNSSMIVTNDKTGFKNSGLDINSPSDAFKTI